MRCVLNVSITILFDYIMILNFKLINSSYVLLLSSIKFGGRRRHFPEKKSKMFQVLRKHEDFIAKGNIFLPKFLSDSTRQESL